MLYNDIDNDDDDDDVSKFRLDKFVCQIITAVVNAEMMAIPTTSIPIAHWYPFKRPNFMEIVEFIFHIFSQSFWYIFDG